MSKALAEQFCAAIRAHPITTNEAPDADFLTACAEMTVTAFTDHFGKDYAG